MELEISDEPTVTRIAGLDVLFPPGRSPFASQKAVISQALSALRGGTNGLLESPTGTGKTLALLAATLSWQRVVMDELAREEPTGTSAAGADAGEAAATPARRRRPPKIFYASRTHAQLTQVARELERMPSHYTDCGNGRDGFLLNVLGARNRMCIHSHAQRAAARAHVQGNVDDLCSRLTRPGGAGCAHKHRTRAQRDALPAVFDLEDAVAVGREARGCPYYAARETTAEASVVLCPYNYVLDGGIRRRMGISLKGAVVIIDEAHNIADVASSAASVEASLEQLRACNDELHAVSRSFASARGGARGSVERACDGLRRMAGGLVDFVARAEAASSDRDHEVLSGTAAAAALHAQAFVSPATLPAFSEWFNVLRGACDTEQSGAEAGDVSFNDQPAAEISNGALSLLESLLRSFAYMYEDEQRNVNAFCLVVQRENARGGVRATTMRLWCLDPSIVFREIAGEAHSVLLTSGTLAPLDSFADELGVPFPIRLAAPHVIDVPKQLSCCTVAAAGSAGSGAGQQLLSTYQSQNLPAYQDALGDLLHQVCEATPDGVLMFVPSYALLDKLRVRWGATGTLRRIGRVKRVFFEPRAGSELDTLLTEYSEAVDAGVRARRADAAAASANGSPRGGALLLAVCRGKVSEGLNFADARARCVVIAGIPYPPIRDLRVNLTKEYRTRCAQEHHRGQNGDSWYRQQALRALNQALGRCIRHKDDFGAIILADSRFAQRAVEGALPKWVRPHHCAHAAHAIPRVRAFFESHAAETAAGAWCDAAPTGRPAALSETKAKADDGWIPRKRVSPPPPQRPLPVPPESGIDAPRDCADGGPKGKRPKLPLADANAELGRS